MGGRDAGVRLGLLGPPAVECPKRYRTVSEEKELDLVDL